MFSFKLQEIGFSFLPFQKHLIHLLWFKSRTTFSRKFLCHCLLKITFFPFAFSACSVFIFKIMFIYFIVHCNDYVTFLLNRHFFSACYIFATVVPASVIELQLTLNSKLIKQTNKQTVNLSFSAMEK